MLVWTLFALWICPDTRYSPWKNIKIGTVSWLGRKTTCLRTSTNCFRGTTESLVFWRTKSFHSDKIEPIAGKDFDSVAENEWVARNSFFLIRQGWPFSEIYFIGLKRNSQLILQFQNGEWQYTKKINYYSGFILESLVKF